MVAYDRRVDIDNKYSRDNLITEGEPALREYFPLPPAGVEGTNHSGLFTASSRNSGFSSLGFRLGMTQDSQKTHSDGTTLPVTGGRRSALHRAALDSKVCPPRATGSQRYGLASCCSSRDSTAAWGRGCHLPTWDSSCPLLCSCTFDMSIAFMALQFLTTRSISQHF